MRPIDERVLREHERIRNLLRTVVLHAADAEDGDPAPRRRFAEAVLELKRVVHAHCLAEERLFGHALDEAHEAERRAVLHLRVAVDLEDALLHVADLLRELDREELILSTAPKAAA